MFWSLAERKENNCVGRDWWGHRPFCLCDSPETVTSSIWKDLCSIRWNAHVFAIIWGRMVDKRGPINMNL